MLKQLSPRLEAAVAYKTRQSRVSTFLAVLGLFGQAAIATGKITVLDWGGWFRGCVLGLFWQAAVATRHFTVLGWVVWRLGCVLCFFGLCATV